MKKDYFSPDLEVVKFSFEKMLGDPAAEEELLYNIQHSLAEDIAEQSGEGNF